MPATVYEKLSDTAAHFPERDVLVYPGWLAERWALPQAAWTYAEIVRITEQLARRYREAGYGPGHRVAMLLENRPEHFFHWLALNAVGASKVPLNPDYREEEMRYVLEHSEAQLVIADALRDRVAPAADKAGLRVVPSQAEELPPPRRKASGARGEAAECALLYTSGTTGKPKGCMLSNGYFFGWGEWYEAQRGLISLRRGEERLMQALPTFHINAVGNSFMGMVFTGGAQIMLDRFHSSTWWRDAVETRATCFHYLGVIPAMLMNVPPSEYDRAHRLRFGLGGGVHPAHHAAFEARFGVPLVEGWAMTETGGAGLMTANVEPRHVGKCCIGKPDRPGPPLDVRVADDAGNELPRGEPGELLVRAKGAEPRRRFFSGYFKDPAATEHAWRGGWLHSGDIVAQDADGSIFFLDRKKNIIRRSGENIAGIEVESVLLTHPAVGQVAVLAARDEIRGEEVMAVVATRPGFGRDRVLAESIADHCLAQLAYYKAPGYVAFRDQLPTTSTQKVRLSALGELIANPAAQADCFDLRERKQKRRTAR
jgi:acyl-CoA synthetase (AMP-forming)/AMP-acid ligase II